jgi:hypothetical protein
MRLGVTLRSSRSSLGSYDPDMGSRVTPRGEVDSNAFCSRSTSCTDEPRLVFPERFVE